MVYRMLFFGMVLVLIGACSGPKGIVKVVSPEDQETAADSVEYELITFDNRFETWYVINNSPSLYRSQDYYESWNKQYVSAWNNRVVDPNGGSFFEPIVGYQYGTDYGFDLNHKLFYYFQYVEHRLNIPILYGTGPHVSLIYR